MAFLTYSFVTSNQWRIFGWINDWIIEKNEENFFVYKYEKRREVICLRYNWMNG